MLVMKPVNEVAGILTVSPTSTFVEELKANWMELTVESASIIVATKGKD